MLEKHSFCKVNLLLNILGKRADGFHELETVMHPVNLCDALSFHREGSTIQFTCSDPALPADSTNLVVRAAAAFLKTAGVEDGISIHLKKRIPVAAGLGGGSGNAAATLLALNELFGHPLEKDSLSQMAAALGSDVPFFLQNRPALATGRGEAVLPLDFFPALRRTCFLLAHPGFGISTPWAYGQLARFDSARNGRPGRARELISLLQGNDAATAGREFYNALEAPALEKYPLLELFLEFFRENGAAGALMSGSGSVTFALFGSQAAAETVREEFKGKFGEKIWTAVAPVNENRRSLPD
jgi:4-diphosphocytidyl-2-C-methyl-D-erythritol kinase